MPWKVPIHRKGRASFFMSRHTRSFISPAALLVKVTARMLCAETCFSRRR